MGVFFKLTQGYLPHVRSSLGSAGTRPIASTLPRSLPLPGAAEARAEGLRLDRRHEAREEQDGLRAGETLARAHPSLWAFRPPAGGHCFRSGVCFTAKALALMPLFGAI